MSLPHWYTINILEALWALCALAGLVLCLTIWRVARYDAATLRATLPPAPIPRARLWLVAHARVRREGVAACVQTALLLGAGRSMLLPETARQGQWDYFLIIGGYIAAGLLVAWRAVRDTQDRRRFDALGAAQEPEPPHAG